MARDLISWHKKEIALIQMQVQIDAVRHTYERVEVQLTADSPPAVWKVYDGLKLELKAMRAAQLEIEQISCKPKNLWSSLVVKLYVWATKERFPSYPVTH